MKYRHVVQTPLTDVINRHVLCLLSVSRELLFQFISHANILQQVMAITRDVEFSGRPTSEFAGTRRYASSDL